MKKNFKKNVKIAAAVIHSLIDQIGPLAFIAITRAVLEQDVAYARRHSDNDKRADIETMFEAYKDFQLAADEAYSGMGGAIQYELKVEPVIMTYRKVRREYNKKQLRIFTAEDRRKAEREELGDDE